MPDKRPVPAAAALERLREGNRRFVASLADPDRPLSRSLRPALTAHHDPFAVILGCSDARVPAEMVFDQGLGDLFVIRVAGNIVAPSQVGSVEFATSRFGTRLVVVLGHSQCGAILATLDELNRPREDQSPNLAAIVNRVRPAVETLLRIGVGNDHEALVRHAVRANVATSVDHLRHGSALLEKMIQEDGLAVVGAEYSLHTGEVTFFDD